MKIYFGFTVAGDRSGIDTARKVVHQLEKMGHEVSLSEKSFTGRAGESEISALGLGRNDGMEWNPSSPPTGGLLWPTGDS